MTRSCGSVIFPTLRAGAIYARKYLLGTSMARPMIARRQAEIAVELGADALSHGCTGKGNDQVRFELAYAAFAPELKVIAPWREWDIRSREDAIAYAAERGNLPITATKEKIYSRDRNLWHISHEGGAARGSGERAAGGPVHADAVAGECAGPGAVHRDRLRARATRSRSTASRIRRSQLIEQLNEIGGVHGIGRADIVEDRLVGMKSRGVYETPGGTLLYTAHRELEQLVLDRRTLALKDDVAQRYADLVYEGRWWSTEREALDGLVDTTQRRVTGTVRLKLYKGNAIIAGRKSPFSLYDEGLASFGDAGNYDHADAEGFIRLFSLPTRADARQREKLDNALFGGLHTNGATPVEPSFAKQLA